jgi:hypothetical protein
MEDDDMAAKWVKISEFARKYGVTDRHARRLLNESESDMCGHFEKRGNKGTWIDDVGEEILRSKLRNPIEYLQMTVEDDDPDDLRQQIVALQGELLAAYKTVADERALRADLTVELGQQRLLAAQTDGERARAERAEERAETAEQIAEAAGQEAERAKIEAAELRAKLDRLANAGWFERRRILRDLKGDG